MSFHLAHVESIQTTTGPHQAPHGQLHQMWATKKWSSVVSRWDNRNNIFVAQKNLKLSLFVINLMSTDHEEGNEPWVQHGFYVMKHISAPPSPGLLFKGCRFTGLHLIKDHLPAPQNQVSGEEAQV